MKLNQELLFEIQDKVASENGYKTFINLVESESWKSYIPLIEEVCRRYSEQIIKCDVCEGSGEREIYHEVCGHSPVVCEFCGGKGYIDEKA